MSAKHYTEQNFEEHIEEYLFGSGYQKSLPEHYDKDLCLISDEVITFVQNPA